jgi:16S rRNA (guanine966-N2)-methyltransferase
MATIASGKFKHKKLIVPEGDVRPAQRLLRLAVFNFLGDFIEHASVLDLFAGTGSFGLEAVSRGARKVVFVDIASKSIEAIKQNIAEVGLKELTAVYQMDILVFLLKSLRKNRKFDIIFIDPPFSKLYQMEHEKRDSYMLEIIDRCKSMLNPKSLIIVKHPKKYPLPIPTGLAVADERRYGVNRISYLVQEEYLNQIEDTAHAVTEEVDNNL